MAGQTGWSPGVSLLDENSLISSLSSGGRSLVQKRVRKEGHALVGVNVPYPFPSEVVPLGMWAGMECQMALPPMILPR